MVAVKRLCALLYELSHELGQGARAPRARAILRDHTSDNDGSSIASSAIRRSIARSLRRWRIWRTGRTFS